MFSIFRFHYFENLDPYFFEMPLKIPIFSLIGLMYLCLIVENVEYLKLQPEAEFLDEIEKSLLFTFSSTALP
jgi:hypothetical protein